METRAPRAILFVGRLLRRSGVLFCPIDFGSPRSAIRRSEVSTCASPGALRWRFIVHRIVEHKGSRMSRLVVAIAFIAGVIAIAASLSQCRLVEDRITGVERTPGSGSARSSCVADCNEQYKAGRKAENDRHRAALQACGDDKTCRKTEDELHEANLEQLVAQLQSCKQGCYNEGSIGGGR